MERHCCEHLRSGRATEGQKLNPWPATTAASSARCHSPAAKAHLPSRLGVDTNTSKMGSCRAFLCCFLALEDPFQFSTGEADYWNKESFQVAVSCNSSSCLQVPITAWPWQGTGSLHLSFSENAQNPHPNTSEQPSARKGDEGFEAEPLLQCTLTSSNGQSCRYCLWALDENNDRLG